MKNLKLTLVLAAALAVPSFSGGKNYTQTAFITVAVNGEVPSAPRKIWDKVITREGLVKIVGLQEPQGDDNMGQIGSKLCGKLGGEMGSLVITYVSLENEIRYSWEPDHGGYVCHITFKFAPSGKGTKVTVADAYSDEKPGMVEKNAQDTRAHLAQTIEALKQVVM